MNKSKLSVFTRIYSVIIILLPFLYQYASPLSFLSLGDFVLMFFTVYGLFRIDLVKAKNSIKPLLVFSCAFVLLTVFVSMFSGDYFRFSDAVTIFFKILLYLGVCAVCTQHFNLRYVKKFYFALVGIFGLYLVIQLVYNKTTNGYLPIWLNHDWLFSWEKSRAADLSVLYDSVVYSYRPSSLFLEPGYYVMFVLPALLILLFEDKNIIAAILLYITIILSTSGAGILIGLLAFVAKGVTKIAYFKDKKLYLTRYIYVALALIAVGVLVVILFGNEILPRIFNSFNARITRSLLIFENMDDFHKIFGVGMNNTVNYVNAHSVYTAFDEANLNFGASIVASGVQYGIIGCFIFLVSLFALAVNASRSKTGLMLVLLYIIYAAFEEIIFNFRMGFLLAFVLYYVEATGSKKRVGENKVIKSDILTGAKQGYDYRR